MTATTFSLGQQVYFEWDEDGRIYSGHGTVDEIADWSELGFPAKSGPFLYISDCNGGHEIPLNDPRLKTIC